MKIVFLTCMMQQWTENMRCCHWWLPHLHILQCSLYCVRPPWCSLPQCGRAHQRSPNQNYLTNVCRACSSLARIGTYPALHSTQEKGALAVVYRTQWRINPTSSLRSTLAPACSCQELCLDHGPCQGAHIFHVQSPSTNVTILMGIPSTYTTTSYIRGTSTYAKPMCTNEMMIGALDEWKVGCGPVFGEIFGHNWWRSECLQVQRVTC